MSSAESLINPPTDDADRAPDQPYVEMPENVSSEPKKKEYHGEDAARDAAADLTKAREAATPPPRADLDETGTVRRNYVRLNDGTPIPPNETVTAERAADDLKSIREFEHGLQQPDPNHVASVIDQVRADYHNPQPEQPQQPEQTTQQQAAEQPQDPNAEIRQVLEAHPAVRQALEAELQTVEAHRQHYAQSARAAAQLAGASLFANFPELAGVESSQLQTAIATISRIDPQRGQQASTTHTFRLSKPASKFGRRT
jgi:hypothetical protein